MGERGRREKGEESEEYSEAIRWGKRRVKRRQCRNKAEDNIYKGTPKCYHGEDAITKEARKYHSIAEYMKEQL